MPTVLDALRALSALSGEARPKAVRDWIAAKLGLSEAERSARIPSGQQRFDNRVHWARFYLSEDGLIAKDKRGVWRSTERGAEARLDEQAAFEVFRRMREKMARDEADEDAPAPEPAASTPTSEACWFVGAAWGGYDDHRWSGVRVWSSSKRVHGRGRSSSLLT